jgi:hypothetical protein
LKLQRLKNWVLRTTGNFPRCISVRDMHEAFQIPYVYDQRTYICICIIRSENNVCDWFSKQFLV